MLQVIAAAGGALSLFLLLVLAAKVPRLPADKWLAGWLAAQAIFFGCVLASAVVPPDLALPLLVGGQLALFALGPAQHLYAAAASDQRPPFMSAAATPIAGAALLAALLLWVPVEPRSGGLVIDRAPPWLVAAPLAALLIAALHPLAVLRLARRRRYELEDELSDLGPADPAWLRTWAMAALTTIALLALAAASAVVATWSTEIYVAAGLALQVASIAYVGHRGLTRSSIFRSAAPARLDLAQAGQPDSEALQDFASVLAFLKEHRPHLKPGLTAGTLSDELGWAPERLTRAFRLGGDSSFFDSINRARVEEVQALARDPANAQLSMLRLGLEAGFGSKTALYDAFQRHAGCTPAGWRLGRNRK
jgi:AraC-like DNA-binding protein